MVQSSSHHRVLPAAMELLTWVIGAAAVFAAPLGIVTAVHFVVRMHRRSAEARLKALRMASPVVAVAAVPPASMPRPQVVAAGCGGGASPRPFEGIAADGLRDVVPAGGYAMEVREAAREDVRHGEWAGAASIRGTAA